MMEQTINLPVFNSREFDGVCGDGVSYGFFGRQGGVSHNVYASLNCGAGSDDNPYHVRENRSKVAAFFGQSSDNLLTVHQVHSAKCVFADDASKTQTRPQADAMVTDQSDLILGVLTADCAPVLFKGQTESGAVVIGAAHAGWGGALKGVLENTVAAIQDKGAVIETIAACIGPCIGQASYEVKQDFAEPFLQRDPEDERFFKSARKDGHLMFDLPGYCASRLAQAGVKTVFMKDIDTYFHEEDFFSYRRATHREEKDYGRQISAIMIKKV